MDHTYNNITITATQNTFTGKWGTAFKVGDDEYISPPWADDERTAVVYARGQIDGVLELEAGTFKLHPPEE